jgi:hypothetical protein
MPWTAHYVSDGVYTAFSGATTGDDILGAMKDFFTHAFSRGPRFALFDYTDVTEFDVDYVGLEYIIMEDRRAEGAHPDVAIALVAPAAIVYGLARMWQMRLDPTPWRTIVVTSLPEALRWLGDQGIDTEHLSVPQG